MLEMYPPQPSTEEVFDSEENLFSGDYQTLGGPGGIYEPIKFNGFSELNIPKIETLCDESSSPAYLPFIKSDDINSLQNYVNQPGFNLSNQLDSMIKYAAYFGSIQCFKYLVLNSEDLDSKDKILASCAIAGGNTEIIHILEQKQFSYESAINTAIFFHRYSITDWIIQHYSKANPSYIACAASHNYPTLFYLLSNHIGDINETLHVGPYEPGVWMPISVLCSNHYINLEILKLFVQYGADVNNTVQVEHPYHFDPYDNPENFNHKGTLTPLFLICHQDKINLEAMKFLLEEAKASPSHTSYLGMNSSDQVTPLYALCIPNRIVNHEAIELLLEYTDDVDNGYTYYEEGFIKTPLFALCQNMQDNSKVIKMLIDKGAKVNYKNYEYSGSGHLDRHFYPLYAACQYGNLEVMKLLIENGAKINKKSCFTATPLAALCVSPKVNVALIDYMLENGANVNGCQKDDDEISPLHALIEFNSDKIEVMKHLIDKGADKEAENPDGETPYDVACDNCDESNLAQIEELLKP